MALTSDHTAFNLPYGASKGALDRIVLAAATELADLASPPTSSTLAPTTPDGWTTNPGGGDRRNLQARVGTPADTANLVSFLLSEQGGWINGQLLHSDGGVGRS